MYLGFDDGIFLVPPCLAACASDVVWLTRAVILQKIPDIPRLERPFECIVILGVIIGQHHLQRHATPTVPRIFDEGRNAASRDTSIEERNDT